MPHPKSLPYSGPDELIYLVAPSFQAEYGVKIRQVEGAFRIWTLNAPGTELPCDRTKFPKGTGRKLDVGDSTTLSERLRRVRLSLFADGPMGLDGTTYQLSLRNGLITSQFCWWCDLPEGWEDLQALLELLESCAARYGRTSAVKGPSDLCGSS